MCRMMRLGCCGGGAVISFSMFQGLVTGVMAAAVAAVADEGAVTELRLRVGRPLVVLTAEARRTARLPSGAPFVVRRDDIERVLAVASDFSVYAVNDQLVRGYVSRRGIRIGVAGEGVAEGGRLITIKHIAFLTVRIPHEVKGAADGVEVKGAADGVRGAVFGGGVKNTLVISPPYGGKTTMLRELARLASERCDTLVIDERFELAAAENGVPTLDVGDCDVVSGVGKLAAYENTIRAMGRKRRRWRTSQGAESRCSRPCTATEWRALRALPSSAGSSMSRRPTSCSRPVPAREPCARC